MVQIMSLAAKKQEHGFYEAPYRLPETEFDPEKSSRQVALEVVQALSEDASWQDVLEALTKARCYVFDHGTAVDAMRKGIDPNARTIPMRLRDAGDA